MTCVCTRINPVSILLGPARHAIIACIALLAIVSASTRASAQTPVQWTKADGGNGHWYQRVEVGNAIGWSEADLAARAAGGLLVTMTSPAEAAWVRSQFVTNQSTCGSGAPGELAIWIGLAQDESAPTFSEPAGGWRWITGEELGETSWASGEPDDGGGGSDRAGLLVSGEWADFTGSPTDNCVRSFVIEWSSDCNGDGAVDLGQILAGELSDANANGVADCCEGLGTPTDDCNANGEFDACELSLPGADTDGDFVLDECERKFGDLNLDSEVGAPDLALLLSAWGSTAPSSADLNGDGEVGAQDLALLLSRWGQTPPWMLPKIVSVTPGSGSSNGGTAITIDGWNLAGTTAVTVGDGAATNVAVVDPKRVTATTPAGTPGTVSVSVTTPLGTANAPDAFTYILGSPTITAVVPAGGATVGGASVTITGSGFEASMTVRVGDNAAPAVTVLSPTVATFVTPAGSVGPANVTVTTSTGSATATGAFHYVVVPAWATMLEALPDPSIITKADLRAAIMAVGRPWRVTHTATQMEMVLIPPGSFNMGCLAANSCFPEEFPVRTVVLPSAFYLGRFEVTQGQWTAVMGSNPSQFQGPDYPEAVHRPVEMVSWNTIQNFLAPNGMRLPTEAEWEFAYRAGTTTVFHAFDGAPNGTDSHGDLPLIGWIDSNSGGQARRVGQKAANGFGLHDMSGNVLELVSDWYFLSYNGASTVAPRGAANGTVRVCRGGSWNLWSYDARASRRLTAGPGGVASSLGFRAVREVSDMPLPFVQQITPTVLPSQVPTTITIKGLHLGGITEVSVGGVAATNITVVDAMTITAVVSGLAAGSKDVAVTTPAGTSNFPNAIWLVDPPTIAAVSPAFGPLGGGTQIEITGTNFYEPVTVQIGGVNATNASLVSWTRILAYVPASAAGPRDVRVTTVGGSFTLPNGFTYVAPPTLSAVSPNGGPASGGTVITLTGTNFMGSATVKLNGVLATNVSILSPTTIVATTPSSSLGAKTVLVTTPGGMASIFNGFTYFGLPTVASVNPALGPPQGGVPVTISGSQFYGTPTVTFGGVPATNVVVASTTTITAVPPPGVVGPAVVSVSTQSGTGSNASAYAYVDAPSVASVFPDNGAISGGTQVVITGARFYPPVSVSFGGVAATNVQVLSESTIAATTPPGAAGPIQLTVTTASGTFALPSAFTYTTNWYSLLEALPDPAVVTKESLRSAIIATGLPWRVRDHGTQIEMLLVPPGTYQRGCNGSLQCSCGVAGWDPHTVTLTSPFYLGRYEVMQKEWIARMGSNPSGYSGQNRPVERVSWNSVQNFLASSGLRLPTEAEWEFACRAGVTTAFHAAPAYPGGTDNDDLVGAIAWYNLNSTETSVVGGKAANSLGFRDMAGNVYEWLSDWYGPYPTTAVVNPVGPATGTARVVRGGAYNSSSCSLRCGARGLFGPTEFYPYLGFRVARSP